MTDESPRSCAPGTICTWVDPMDHDGVVPLIDDDYGFGWPFDVEFCGRDALVGFNGGLLRVEPDGGAVHVLDGVSSMIPYQAEYSWGFSLSQTHVACNPLDPDVVLVHNRSELATVSLTTELATYLWFTWPKYPLIPPITSVAYDELGRRYFSMMISRTVVRMEADGTLTRIAGVPGMWGYTGDGGPATEALLSLWGIDPVIGGQIKIVGSDLYIADTGNNVIRRVDLDTGIIETVAGRWWKPELPTGSGPVGDGGPALDALLTNPFDVEIGPDGAMYIAEWQSCVRRVDPDGTIETFAGRCGEPGYAGDGGPPTEALLERPVSVGLDPDGNLYIVDNQNYAIRIVAPELE